MNRMQLISRAVEVLNRGGVIVYPTETVYGLGCDPFSHKAVKRIFEIKMRDESEPLSLAVSSFEMLDEVAYLDKESMKFASRFLPGPVTILLRKKAAVPDYITAGSQVVGIRLPDHRLALELISAFGKPVTSTSANISGEPAPSRAPDVKVKADLLIDGGECKYGAASTIVDPVNKKIVRKGAKYDEVQRYLERARTKKG